MIFNILLESFFEVILEIDSLKLICILTANATRNSMREDDLIKTK